MFYTTRELTAVCSKVLREQIITGNNRICLLFCRSYNCMWELELEGEDHLRSLQVHLQ